MSTGRSTVTSNGSRAARFAAIGVLATGLVAVPVAGASAAVHPRSSRPGSAAALGTAPVVSAPTGWLRIAHLAPGVPPMDIYLTSSDGRQVVLRHAGYGTFTDYQTLQPGTYALALRTAGSSAMSAPVASYQVVVTAGKAATVAAIGSPGHLSTELFDDALVRPPAGSARVRLIQGAPAAASVTVSAVDGPLLAQDVPYGAVTGYANVPQGRWTLKVTEDGKSTATQVDVAAGGVYSLVVVQGRNGELTLDTGVDVSGKPVPATGRGKKAVSMTVTTDAADSTTAPAGSVDTGEGGTAGLGAGLGATSGSGAVDDAGTALTGVLGLGLAAAVLRRRRATAGR